MKDDLLPNLPQEMMSEILGRLPIRSIITCMCVCKTWRHLIEVGELYTRKPAIAFAHEREGYTICDAAFKPHLGIWLPSSHTLHAASGCTILLDSANGLLFVWDTCGEVPVVCNPMTREYAMLPPMRGCSGIFGFGMSKISGQYKILYGDIYSSWHVYTLGREGSWRRMEVVAPRTCGIGSAPFLNGNLHWLASDLEGNLLLSRFNLETELFTSFPLPIPHLHERLIDKYELHVLDGKLWLCDISDNLYVIWKMNDYGDTNSWIREYTLPDIYGLVSPLSVLANGDLIFRAPSSNKLLIYSKNTKSVVAYSRHQPYQFYSSNITFYTPSFRSLTTMGIQNVKSLKDKTFPLVCTLSYILALSFCFNSS